MKQYEIKELTYFTILYIYNYMSDETAAKMYESAKDRLLELLRQEKEVKEHISHWVPIVEQHAKLTGEPVEPQIENKIQELTPESEHGAVKKCAGELGRTPNLSDFRRHTNISPRQVRRFFGTYTRMLHESGVERQGPGCVVSLRSMFEDWGQVVRTLGRIPTMADYELEGRY